jgi:hypothetical protein
VEHLLCQLSRLFELKYTTRKIQEQWKVSRTILVYKNKGSMNDIKNYGPIAHLCLATNFFEYLILKRILEIQIENEIKITGSNQMGSKGKKHLQTVTKPTIIDS